MKAEHLQAVRIPLEGSVGSRFAASIAMLLFAIVALAALVVAVSVAGPVEETVIAAIIALIGLGAGWIAWSLGRTAFHKGAWIDLGGSEMTIHHPIVFSRDLIVPRVQVSAAAVNAAEEQHTWWLDEQFDLVREKHGIKMLAGRDELREALHASARLTVPLVDEDDQTTPNTIVVFDRPVHLANVRRGLRTGVSVTWVKRAERDQQAKGLLFRAADPSSAREAFAQWELRSQLSGDDGDILVPAAEDIKRFRRYKILAFVGAVVGALVIAGEIYDAIVG